VSGASGNIKERNVMAMHNSPVAKFKEDLGPYTNIGAFGDDLEQQIYIECYLLSNFLTSESGKLLIS